MGDPLLDHDMYQEHWVAKLFEGLFGYRSSIYRSLISHPGEYESSFTNCLDDGVASSYSFYFLVATAIPHRWGSTTTMPCPTASRRLSTRRMGHRISWAWPLMDFRSMAIEPWTMCRYRMGRPLDLKTCSMEAIATSTIWHSRLIAGAELRVL
jgi:hypothetical protein